MKAALFYKSDDTLGEGALCHPVTNRLFWVDIVGQKLKSIDLDGSNLREYPMPSMVSTVVPADGSDVVVALADCIARLNTSTGLLTLLTPVEACLPDNRSNDGKCDPAGRLWFGTMHLEGKSGAGKLYSLGAGEPLTIRLDRQTVPNGIVWHAGTMYYIDTADRCVRAFDFDAPTGRISNERIAIEVPNTLGSPDGMAVDAAGRLWIALWGSGAIGCWDPTTGQMINRIEVDAPLVTSCAFGGPDGRSLFITTARFAMSPDALAAHPLSGSLFVCRDMPCAGSEAPQFKL